jgi:hypothetical protein
MIPSSLQTKRSFCFYEELQLAALDALDRCPRLALAGDGAGKQR